MYPATLDRSGPKVKRRPSNSDTSVAPVIIARSCPMSEQFRDVLFCPTEYD
jgi:hypothetical protein